MISRSLFVLVLVLLVGVAVHARARPTTTRKPTTTTTRTSTTTTTRTTTTTTTTRTTTTTTIGTTASTTTATTAATTTATTTAATTTAATTTAPTTTTTTAATTCPGLKIVRINDPSLTTSAMGSQSLANVQAGFDAAAQILMNICCDPITVTITLAVVAGTGTLGESNTYIVPVSYTNLHAAFLADSKTTDDATAYASDVSVTDPTGSGPWYVTKAQAKALGLAANDVTTDGTFTFGSGFSYTFDPNNRAVAGEYDFIGIALHEITEIMGRIPGLGSGNLYLAYDLFRYRGVNTRGITNTGAGNYFSINAGTTDLKDYNNAATNGGDPQDWASGTNDAFNAFSSSGVDNALSTVDEQVMDVIGYDRRAGQTQPSSVQTNTAPASVGGSVSSSAANGNSLKSVTSYLLPKK